MDDKQYGVAAPKAEFVEVVQEDGSVKYVNARYDEIVAEVERELAENPPVFDELTEEEMAWDAVNNVHNARIREYPQLGEQLDKLFHDIENGTLDQNGEFFTAIKAVKDANPKP